MMSVSKLITIGLLVETTLESASTTRRRDQEYSVQSMRRTDVREWLQRIRGEYAEIPDLHLTEHQAHRLWGLDPVMCRALLDCLVRAGFLRRTDKATYIRTGK
jgi:hypothetical protein